MVKEICFGKNVSLKIKNIEIVQGFMCKTRRNFSQTMNIIIEQWDNLSIALQRIQEEQTAQKKLEYIKSAEVIDPVKRHPIDPTLVAKKKTSVKRVKKK